MDDEHSGEAPRSDGGDGTANAAHAGVPDVWDAGAATDAGAPADAGDHAQVHDAADGASAAGDRTSLRARYFPPRVQYALAGAAVLVILAFIFIPRFTEKDPYAALGEEGSPARSVADILEAEMSCTAGEIGDKHSILACYQQTADRVSIVFLQSTREGQVASYTVETQPLGATPDTGQAINIANQVAAVATPGTGFADCSHSYDSEYFCFGSLASWSSSGVPPIESTGEKKRLPSVDDLGARLNEQGGWECEYGICTNGETSMTTAQSLTGLGLQFAAPVKVEHVRQAIAALLEETGETDDLQEWTETIDGSLNIVVADGFVVGYVPQIGESGLVVVDEVAGVLPDTA